MSRTAQRALLIVVLLLALGLRLHRLDAQSLWNDEGNSARIAERPLALIVEGARGDIHPPGYYLLLHYWRAAFGAGEFALRSLSALSSLALVLFTYLLGRRLFDAATGLTAAFLGALAPLSVYYAQEARMYALLAALAAASTYLLVRLLDEARHRPAGRLAGPMGAYVVLSAAGLYTQYIFPFVLLVHNAIFALWWLSAEGARVRRRRWALAWASAQAAILLLYLPWLPATWRSVTGWSPPRPSYTLGAALGRVLGVLTTGVTLPPEAATLPTLFSLTFLALGLWPHPRTSRGRRAVINAGLYLGLPVALIFALDLYRPAYLKFLLLVLPAFHGLIAHGAHNAGRLLGRAMRTPRRRSTALVRAGLPILFALAASVQWAPSLRNLYFDPRYARDDYRQIAADIAAQYRTGDAVLLNAPNQWEVFTYYYPDRDVLPAPYRRSPQELAAFLEPLRAQYRRLYVLYWGDAEADPEGFVEGWLADHAYPAETRWYGDVRLATYGLGALPQEPATTVDASFEGGIRLAGYTVPARVAAGEILPATLFWRVERPIEGRYKVALQLLDAGGQVVAQHDGEPAAGTRPLPTWAPGQRVLDRHGIPVPPQAAPGSYPLIVVLYDAVTGQRLPMPDAASAPRDHLPLTSIRVTAP
jgi:hypothetical protein